VAPPIGLTGAIARRVRALREERRWSAEDLAERLTAAGVPTKRAALANLENGRRRDITVAELFALSRVLCVPPILLFGEPLDTVPLGATDDGDSMTTVELLDWFAGVMLPMAIDQDGTACSDYESAAAPLAAHRRHSELLDRVLDAHLDLPAGSGLDRFREPVKELARHRVDMRERGEREEAQREHDKGPDRRWRWRPPDLYEEVADAVEDAEQRVRGMRAGYRRISHPATSKPPSP
jgi:transcriptional regulator with XRE-family HTH domain